MGEKIFTIKEVENLIPLLEEKFEEINFQRNVIAKISGEINKAATHAEFGGGTPLGPEYITALHLLNQKIDEILKEGVLIKDINKGLCDFPYFLNGRTVYLCWKSGEPSLQWWHEVDAGFVGRQPMKDL